MSKTTPASLRRCFEAGIRELHVAAAARNAQRVAGILHCTRDLIDVMPPKLAATCAERLRQELGAMGAFDRAAVPMAAVPMIDAAA